MNYMIILGGREVEIPSCIEVVGISKSGMNKQISDSTQRLVSKCSAFRHGLCLFTLTLPNSYNRPFLDKSCPS